MARPASHSSLLIALTRAGAKAAASRLRRLGIRVTHANWALRAEICERCPMRVIQCGRSYCGKPLLGQVRRDPALEGCGCPTHAKAQDPREHCPIDVRLTLAERQHGSCTCRWCAAGFGPADQ